MNTIKEKWEILHAQSRFRPKYPDESVLRFIFCNFKRDGSEKVLDLGCGGGRHTILMANEGIIPYGIDISEEGVRNTKELLINNGYECFANNVTCDNFESLPYENEFFQGIFAYGTLYYGGSKVYTKAIGEMYRTLVKGGACLAVVRGHKDYRYGQGREVEPNTFVIDVKDDNASALAEAGMTMHFFTEDELREAFSAFCQVSIDTVAFSRMNGKYLNFDYLVTAIK